MIKFFNQLRSIILAAIFLTCSLVLFPLADESQASNKCESLDNYFTPNERSDGVHELRCLDGNEAHGVNIDYEKKQCTRFTVLNTGKVLVQEELAWEDCHEYRQRDKLASAAETDFAEFYAFEKFKLEAGCQEKSAIKPYSDFVFNHALMVYTKANRLEEAGKLPEALEIFQLAERCCADEDCPLVRKRIAILKERLSNNAGD